MSKNKSKFRMIQQSFWSDPKVVEEFTPEDKLIFLYLMTNQLTTQIGIYPITRKHIAYETGYSAESIKSIMDRFIHSHKIIKYDETTRELFIINWGKHNYRTGGKPIEDLVRSELSAIKNKEFIREAASIVPSDSIKKIFLEFCDESYHESYDESYNDTGYEKENKKENEKKNEKRINKPIERSSTILESFELIWKEFPKKSKKKQAFEAYKRAKKKGVEDQTILDGIEAYKQMLALPINSWRKVQEGGTWFNQERWDDEYEEVEKSRPVTPDIPLEDINQTEEVAFSWSKN